MTKNIKGYIFAIIAAVTYGMNPLFALPLYKDGLNAESVLFLRYSIAIVFLFIMLKYKKNRFFVTKKEYIIVVILGLLMATSSVGLFMSYNYMDVGIASTLLFIYPILVAILMCIFFKERLKITTVICLISTFLGVLLLYKKSDGCYLSSLGLALLVLSAVTYALYLIVVNTKKIKNLQPLTITIHVLIIGSLFFFFTLNFGYNLILPTKSTLWLNILALAFFPTTISFICTTKATQYIGATPTALFGALEPVTGIFFGVVFFGEILTYRSICGMILILASVCIVIANNKLKKIKVIAQQILPFYKK